MKFKKVIKPEIKGQKYDLNEYIMKAGEKYVYYDRIQAARVDTEITKTLEKYGCLDPIIVNKEQMYIDIRNMKTDARSLTEMTMKADEMWNKLPHNVKAKFENNRDLFMKDGEKWLKSEIDKTKVPDLKEATPTTINETKGE